MARLFDVVHDEAVVRVDRRRKDREHGWRVGRQPPAKQFFTVRSLTPVQRATVLIEDDCPRSEARNAVETRLANDKGTGFCRGPGKTFPEFGKDIRSNRAAAYVRMSTDHQHYSTENQLETIRRFAAARDIEIIRIYEDAGKSGLNLEGRDAFRRLLSHVERGTADFCTILVLRCEPVGPLPEC